MRFTVEGTRWRHLETFAVSLRLPAEPSDLVLRSFCYPHRKAFYSWDCLIPDLGHYICLLLLSFPLLVAQVVHSHVDVIQTIIRTGYNNTHRPLGLVVPVKCRITLRNQRRGRGGYIVHRAKGPRFRSDASSFDGQRIDSRSRSGETPRSGAFRRSFTTSSLTDRQPVLSQKSTCSATSPIFSDAEIELVLLFCHSIRDHCRIHSLSSIAAYFPRRPPEKLY